MVSKDRCTHLSKLFIMDTCVLNCIFLTPFSTLIFKAILLLLEFKIFNLHLELRVRILYEYSPRPLSKHCPLLVIIYSLCSISHCWWSALIKASAVVPPYGYSPCASHLARSLSLLRCWKKDGSQMSCASWHTCLHECPGSAIFTCSVLRGGHITWPWQKSWKYKITLLTHSQYTQWKYFPHIYIYMDDHGWGGCCCLVFILITEF